MIAGASTLREALDGWLAKKQDMPAGSWVNCGWQTPSIALREVHLSRDLQCPNTSSDEELMVIGQMGQHHQPCWMGRGSLQDPQVLWTMLIFLFLTKGRGATSGNEEMEAFSCPKTALVGSLDIILHFVSDERALFPSLGTDRGRFSQERRLFIFTLRWGVRYGLCRKRLEDQSDLVTVGLYLPWGTDVQESSHMEHLAQQTKVWSELQSHQDHPPLFLPWELSLSHFLCVFIQGTVWTWGPLHGELFFRWPRSDWGLDRLTSHSRYSCTALQRRRFDQRKKLPHLGFASEWSRPQDERNGLDLESGALNFGK